MSEDGNAKRGRVTARREILGALRDTHRRSPSARAVIDTLALDHEESRALEWLETQGMIEARGGHRITARGLEHLERLESDEEELGYDPILANVHALVAHVCGEGLVGQRLDVGAINAALGFGPEDFDRCVELMERHGDFFEYDKRRATLNMHTSFGPIHAKYDVLRLGRHISDEGGTFAGFVRESSGAWLALSVDNSTTYGGDHINPQQNAPGTMVVAKASGGSTVSVGDVLAGEVTWRDESPWSQPFFAHGIERLADFVRAQAGDGDGDLVAFCDYLEGTLSGLDVGDKTTREIGAMVLSSATPEDVALLGRAAQVMEDRLGPGWADGIKQGVAGNAVFTLIMWVLSIAAKVF